MATKEEIQSIINASKWREIKYEIIAPSSFPAAIKGVGTLIYTFKKKAILYYTAFTSLYIQTNAPTSTPVPGIKSVAEFNLYNKGITFYRCDTLRLQGQVINPINTLIYSSYFWQRDEEEFIPIEVNKDEKIYFYWYEIYQNYTIIYEYPNSFFNVGPVPADINNSQFIIGYSDE